MSATRIIGLMCSFLAIIGGLETMLFAFVKDTSEKKEPWGCFYTAMQVVIVAGSVAFGMFFMHMLGGK